MSDENKRALAVPAPTRRQMMTGAALAAGLSIAPGALWANDEQGLSHSAEAIHQEPVFKADRKRVYGALTDSAQFHKVTMMGEAMRSGMAPAGGPTLNEPALAASPAAAADAPACDAA